MQGRCSSPTLSIFILNASRPTVLTIFFRLTVPLRFVPLHLARNRSASSSVAIIAESVAASSAGSTRPTRCDLTSLRGSIPKASCTVLAIAATAHFASGNTCVLAAPTAKAPVVVERLPSLSRLLPLSAQRMLALAALRRASKEPGTGVPSESITSMAYTGVTSPGPISSTDGLYHFPLLMISG